MRPSFLLLLPAVLSAQLAIRNVTVINPRGGGVLAATTVLIEGETILRVGPSVAVAIPKGFRQVDGTSRYLIPGLWDCHVPLTKAGKNSLALFLANGVTSVRDMGSDPHEVMAWRREIESGKTLGPRIKLAGRILESKDNVERMKREGGVEPVDRVRFPVANAEEARAAVAELKRIGVDHLKARTVPNPETFAAMADAAKAVGLKLTGHAVAAPRDMIGKLQSVEHLLAYPPLDQMSDGSRRDLFRRMRDSGAWISTTLVNIEGSILVSYERAKALVDESTRQDRPSAPLHRRLSAFRLAGTSGREEGPRAGGDGTGLAPAVPAVYSRFPGVRFLAGTDVAVALIYPGFSMHQELEL